ncbi:MAG: hypothetical protein ACK5CE_08540 [Actinomycetes bacterium]
MALGLFVEGEHHRPLRRVEVQPDDIDELGFEARVAGQLERADLSWPQIPGLPDPRDGVFADTVFRAE